MVSRRLLRIKAMQTYYGFKQNDSLSLESALKELEKSVSQSYDLYVSLFCLLLKVRDFSAKRIEIRQKKLLPSQEDLNPNKKFIDNFVFQKISDNVIIQKYYKNSSLNWDNHPDFVALIWEKIETSDFFITYMSNKTNSMEDDKNIFRKIIFKIIAESDELTQLLEDINIYWNDDLELLLSIIIKNINKLEIYHEAISLDKLYKSDEDRRFGVLLLKHTILHSDKYDEIIMKFLQKWELERVAFLDRIILHLGLSEILHMPDIPVKVSINEYLDIAKFYSTAKSNNFINGILDAVYIQEKANGTLNKSGKGMVN